MILRLHSCTKELSAPTSALLNGGQLAPDTSAPGSKCWPEERAWRGRNSGEAAVIGGNNLLLSPPPATNPLTEGNRQLRRAHCSSEDSPRRLRQLRGANVCRRRVCGGRRNSCEAAVVGGNNLLVSPPPATNPLTEGNRQLR